VNRLCVHCEFVESQVMQGQIQRMLVCKRFPPSMSMVQIPPSAGRPPGIQGMTQFPVVQAAMWCHEFKPRVTLEEPTLENVGPAHD
jgi:hypothetical protein